MLYSEFRKKYAFVVKSWPEVSNLYGSDVPLKVTRTSYERHGSRWHVTESEKFDSDFWFFVNVLDGVPFFRNIGGFERVEKSYSKYGYLPYKVNSISPDRTQKIVWQFDFI